MVLGNKIDKQGAIPEEDITAYFGLHQHLTGKVPAILAKGKVGWGGGELGVVGIPATDGV